MRHVWREEASLPSSSMASSSSSISSSATEETLLCSTESKESWDSMAARSFLCCCCCSLRPLPFDSILKLKKGGHETHGWIWRICRGSRFSSRFIFLESVETCNNIWGRGDSSLCVIGPVSSSPFFIWRIKCNFQDSNKTFFGNWGKRNNSNHSAREKMAF